MTMHVFIQGASRGLGLALTQALCARDQVERVYASARRPEASSGLFELERRVGAKLRPIALDLNDESTIAAAAASVVSESPRLHLFMNVAGLLHDARAQPEKRLEHIELDAMVARFAVNAFGPLLTAKHFIGLLTHDQRAVLANLSARVGSIEDNRLGGWYSYRASKAAQNMFTKTLAIELRRRARNIICVALHPGTVDTSLSKPFQRGVSSGRLFTPALAASQLLSVIDSLGPDDSGSFLAWDRSPIPW